MMNNKGKISIVLVIIFAFIGFGVISAGIHDIIFFGQYEDAIAIPVGLFFALPPMILYINERRNENEDEKTQAFSQDKVVLWIFIIIHVLVLIILFSNTELQDREKAIVSIYCFCMIGYSIYKLKAVKDNPDQFYKITYKDFKTKETKTIDVFNESGERKSYEEISKELRSDDTSPIDQDHTNDNN